MQTENSIRPRALEKSVGEFINVITVQLNQVKLTAADKYQKEP